MKPEPNDNHTPNHLDTANSAAQKARLALILRTGRLRLWFYQPSTRHYFLLSEEGNIEQEYNPAEFVQGYDRDDIETLRCLIFDVCDGKRPSAQMRLRTNTQADGLRQHFDITITVHDRDADARPSLLLGLQHDVTEEVRTQEHVDQMLIRYHTIFNTSLLDMMFFDKDGVLTDINDRACDTAHIADRQQAVDGHVLLRDNLLFGHIPADLREGMSASTIIDSDRLRQAWQQAPYSLKGDMPQRDRMYYESTVNPIRDEQGCPDGLYIAGRDITEKVEAFHRQQAAARRLEQGTHDMEQYVNNINYALRVTDVRLVSYDPRAFALELSSDVNKPQQRLSQLRCLRLTAPQSRNRAASVLNRMDRLSPHSIELKVETVVHDRQGRTVWLQFNMVPITDAAGRVDRYLGLCRDITELVTTERLLAVESEHARDAEQLIQAFLTNMSHEIRTPLNSVVGFASLFSTDHDKRDEPFFAEQIKRDTNTLLLLVNDVLLLSRLDAHMEEYKREAADFAKIFDTHCRQILSTADPDVLAIADQPYTTLMVAVDAAKVGIAIGRLSRLICDTVHEGTVSATYEHTHGRLTVSIEATDLQFEPQTAQCLFDRFAHDEEGRLIGTGLDLPIIRLLAQQMGGNAEVEVTETHGTTFRLYIPCKTL